MLTNHSDQFSFKRCLLLMPDILTGEDDGVIFKTKKYVLISWGAVLLFIEDSFIILF
jgi:hypothetical protein